MIYRRFIGRICVAVLAILGASSVVAQSVTFVVDDNFLDGSQLNSGMEPLETAFFTTSSSLALSTDPALATPGFLDFASGSVARQIHTVFTPQSLVNPGDRITASINFTTPDSVSVGLGDTFRAGLFDTSTSPGFTGVEVNSNNILGFPLPSTDPLNPLVDATGTPILDAAGNTQFGATFNQDLLSSTAQPEPGLNINGFVTEIDVNRELFLGLGAPQPTGDIRVRFQDPDPAFRSGRLLITSAGFVSPSLGDGPNVLSDNVFNPNTNLTYTFSIELLASGDVVITSELDGAPAFQTSPAPIALTGSTFDLLALSVSSNAFGVSNANGENLVGEPNNGIDINNVTVTFETVPEPGSAGLLLSSFAALGLFRRRK